ncbi:UDP-glucose 4-epimerase GalE [Candidatus Arthromitus sp. SFB-rat-Yit]|uniref:UDP-glucose 4-epimerase GalE n=1 Tax=Candidatus Arthromitus sp. SFB-rat-Yit TaxID=1041504 RepID=UPI000227A300|nr:UDP-glucose 4-epimerase GalE [Candidatus Arthromitus sp. SFB-rat-Yit]BAK80844.1 UDP-glucose 4-epimerase [Candidatus Arthromitus sp. SFB-rat-Yit]
MKNILVTGATGFIGSHTSVELLENGYNVIGIDNLYNSYKDVLLKIEKITKKSIKFYEGDILDYTLLKKIFKENRIDCVIHFAALKAVGESVEKPMEYYYNNVSGTLNVLNCMKEFDCKNFIYSSSATVYDKDNSIPYLENYKKSATSPYGYTKIMIEQVLNDIYVADNDFSCVMLRYFNPIGAHKSALIGENPKGIPNNLMPYICDVAMSKRKFLNVFGNDYDTIDGTGVRDYVHVVDVAKGHVEAMKYVLVSRGNIGINLGTGKGTSVLELVKCFEKVSGKKINFKICPRRDGDIGEFYADTNKAKEILGWESKFDIEDMCLDSWNYIRFNT